jgi:hypothetical protein
MMPIKPCNIKGNHPVRIKVKVPCQHLEFYLAKYQVNISTLHIGTLGMINDFRLIAAIDSLQLLSIYAFYALQMK